MAPPRAFISFDFDHDLRWKDLFCGQARPKSPTTFAVHDWSSKARLPERQWKELVADKISRCDLMIVLVGKHMASASGVVTEIALAKAARVPVFGVYVDGANWLTALPSGLSWFRVVSWRWNNISARIDQCLKEGKNARTQSFWSRIW